MKPFAHSFGLVTGFVLLLTITPSWGQPVCAAPGCNPTASDENSNTGGGTEALIHVETGFFNTAFGGHALFLNSTGSNNTAIGANALFTTTTGSNNTAIGASALQNNTDGSANTASGANALHSNTTGDSNTASGRNALAVNTTGNSNTASGRGALQSNTDGTGNTASGVFALRENRTGEDNTVSGVRALDNNLTGSKNTAVGVQALVHSLGNKNLAIGFKAGSMLTNGNNNIYLDNLGVADESQTMRLGDTQTRTFIAGIATTTVNGATVEIDTTTGQLGIKTSSARYKKDIEAMAHRSEGLLKLRPVTFSYKDDTAAAPHYGLIAEEVATVYPELVTRTATGEVQTVKYHELIPMLLNELQREHETVATLKQELAELRALVGSRTGQ